MKKPSSPKPKKYPAAGRKKVAPTPANKRPAVGTAAAARTAKSPVKPAAGKFFEPDPKDANTVNALRTKLNQIREYKKILAEDGLLPDADDKELESEIIRQLLRIEKGLTPKKAPPKKRKPRVLPE